MRRSVPKERSPSTVSLPAFLSLSNTIRVWLHRAEVDQAVMFGVMARIWQLLTGPISLLLIARYLTPELQGFYYTFGSLIALQSFVELALYLVIINVASHEWAHLRLDEEGRIAGNEKALSRLVSLGRFIFKWYAAASALFVVGVGIAGYIFFSQETYSGIIWQGPWLTLLILTGLLLWALPFNSLLEGCNQVVAIQKFRFNQAVLSSLALWLTLGLGGGLWAVAVSAAVNVLRDMCLLGWQYRRFFKVFFKPASGPRICWKTEILPMQWRLALSGMVSYFAFSLYNPVMFHYHGAAVAGQMGMTLMIMMAVQSVALMWVHTKVPRFGMLIAKKDYVGLDRFWFRTSLVSLAVASSGSGAAWLLVYGLNALNFPLAERILPPLPTGLFLLGAIFMQISQCQTAYLRAHKQEPIMVMSVTCALLIGLLVWLLGSRFGPVGAAISYLGVVAGLIVPWETYIWFRCRAEWHRV